MGFGSNTPGMGAGGFSGGSAGLGASNTKVYNPYGDTNAPMCGAPGGFAGGMHDMNSMSSMGSSNTTTTTTSVLSKTVNMVSNLKSSVADSAGVVGQAMGFQKKKGIMKDPNAILGNAS